MTDYAIIRTGGKQYRVRSGDTIEVERLPGDVGDAITINEVLLTSVDGDVRVGAPLVDSAIVEAEIAAQGKGAKITVFKYKSKTRYRRKRGHRQEYTSLLVKSISAT